MMWRTYNYNQEKVVRIAIASNEISKLRQRSNFKLTSRQARFGAVLSIQSGWLFLHSTTFGARHSHFEERVAFPVKPYEVRFSLIHDNTYKISSATASSIDTLNEIEICGEILTLPLLGTCSRRRRSNNWSWNSYWRRNWLCCNWSWNGYWSRKWCCYWNWSW